MKYLEWHINCNKIKKKIGQYLDLLKTIFFRRPTDKVSATIRDDGELFFVSYRREDSEDFTYRMCDRLRKHFGEQAVFVDIDQIPFGADFRSLIRRKLAQTRAVLVVIGPNWASERLHDADDPVVSEVEIALECKIPIIPVLTSRARMPTERELPATIASLANRNAIRIDGGRDFDAGVGKLVQALKDMRAVEQYCGSVGRCGSNSDPLGTLKKLHVESLLPSGADAVPGHPGRGGRWSPSVLNLRFDVHGNGLRPTNKQAT
jgi:hypothetical protein